MHSSWHPYIGMNSLGLQPSPQVRWLDPPGTHHNHLLRRWARSPSEYCVVLMTRDRSCPRELTHLMSSFISIHLDSGAPVPHPPALRCTERHRRRTTAKRPQSVATALSKLDALVLCPSHLAAPWASCRRDRWGFTGQDGHQGFVGIGNGEPGI